MTFTISSVKRLLHKVSVFFLVTFAAFSVTHGADGRTEKAKRDNRLGADSVLYVFRNIMPHEYAGRDDIRRVVAAEDLRHLSIGDYAFWNCPDIEDVDLSAITGDATLGEAVFKECGQLRKVSLPRRQKILPKYFCAWDTLLREIILPASLEDIRAHALAYCSSLDTILIPSRVSHIGNNAFSRCTSLRSVRIPDSVTELESYAFSDCVSLSFARLPGNPSLLGELVFSGCHNLRLIEEPSPVPPSFDCASFLFEPEDTVLSRHLTVAVPSASLHLYRTSPAWRLLPSAFFRPLL